MQSTVRLQRVADLEKPRYLCREDSFPPHSRWENIPKEQISYHNNDRKTTTPRTVNIDHETTTRTPRYSQRSTCRLSTLPYEGLQLEASLGARMNSNLVRV